MPSHDQPLGFPIKGLNVSREFDQQPTDTTADCMNVASYDSIAGRNRGGSRAGFTKYVEGQSLTGTVDIQMLKVIIDPQDDALIQASTVPDDTWVEHPRIPDLFVPPHGAPWQPNPNAPKPTKPATTMTINVLLTPGPGGPDVTLRTVTLVATADARTGSSGYAFNWDGTGGGTAIECDADIGFQFPFEVIVSNPPSDDFGSSGNALDTPGIVFVAGGSTSVEFIIHYG